MHAEGISDASAAEVGAAPELVTGLGVGTATGTKLGAGSLAVAPALDNGCVFLVPEGVAG